MTLDPGTNPSGMDAAMSDATGSAFVTSRKGFCYITIKIGRRNFDIMKIRSYTIDAQDKRAGAKRAL